MSLEEYEVIILIVLGIIVAFFILRELWCWYFKINRIVKNQEEQTDILADIRKMMKDALIKDGVLDEAPKPKSSPELLTPIPSDAPNFKADEMIRLNKLREAGEIDDLEFHRQQKEILG